MRKYEENECHEGTIHDIIYYNEENGYVIAVLDTVEELISIKGTIPFIREGDRLRVVGKLELHHFYGEQLNVEFVEHIKPTDIDDVFKYLSSGIITGIGEATAQLIIDAFGTDSLDVIQEKPERLLEITGIGPKKLAQIVESYKEQYELRDFIMHFQSLNISISLAMRIYKKFGIEAITKIETNPYILADELVGVGFRLADQIAMKMGVDFHSPFRIASGITYVLNNEASSGQTYYEKKALVRRVMLELQVKEDEIEMQISDMAVKGNLHIEMNERDEVAVYLPSLFYAEQHVAAKIVNLIQSSESVDFSEIHMFLKEFEENSGILLAEKQKEAIEGALISGVFVITGGPGTGKTTIINAVIKAYEAMNKKVLLAAPTGRAAKRMTETTQRESKTIHRLLEFQGENNFQKNSENPIKTDVVIIDEISMVDIVLMYRLLDAVELGTHVILVGDSDQLPSVGPGNVLKDLLESELVNYIRLDEIYRQSEASLIAVNAHKINCGEMPILNKADKDFFFISHRKAEDVLEEIKNLVIERLPNYYALNPMEDIQVLSPMKNSGVGVHQLNDMLQSVVNPPSKNKTEKVFGKKKFREGDKVMQIKNNYNLQWTTKLSEEGKGVFNGDIGIILEIDEIGRTLTIIFDQEREVIYDYPSADELVLAYAITVHKSQGNEFKAVIMPIHYGPPLLMSRNILYTAITRARELIVLVGEKKVMTEMIRRNQETKRLSGLKSRLNLYKTMGG